MRRIVLTLFFVLWASAVWAATKYVIPGAGATGCSNGNTNYHPLSNTCSGATDQTVYTTINGGIGTLSSGDTLQIRAGTYAENIGCTAIPNGTSSSAPTTIRNYQTETVWLNPSSPCTPAGAIVALNGQYVVVDGLHLDGINLPKTNAFDVGLSSSVLDGVTFQNGEIYRSPASGVFMDGNAILRNNLIHDNGQDVQLDHGLYVHSGANNKIIGNTFFNNKGCGMQLYGDIHPTNGIVEYNTFRDVPSTSSCAVAISVSGSGHIIRYNTIYNVSGTSGNGTGIDINAAATNAVVYNNTLYNIFYRGIAIRASGVTLKNNIAWSSGEDIQVSGGTFAPGGAFDNLCGTGSTGITCTYTTNPQFVSTSIPNFNLQPGSPAINAGTTAITGTISISACGTPPCFNGTAPDLGALESGAPTPPPVSQLVLALPLDAGSGTTAADVSGQGNTATLFGGASWDNSGKYGKAIAFDGSGYLQIPPSASLALAPAMTLEAWVYPTIAAADFATVIQHQKYFLYGASVPGYCPSPASAPVGGYNTTVDQFLCATLLPPLNQWSHLAVTYDGATITVYLNGGILTSRASTDPMVAASANLAIGASEFGEYFTGKIDEVRIYNYSRTPTQIVSDMNTPLIGVPGKYLDIAAPVSVEISSGSSIEIGAD